MAYIRLLLLCTLATICLEEIDAHGMLMLPVNRGSAWRVGYPTPVNYDDNGNYCGGFFVHQKNGKCGTCGDDYQMPQPRPNENGGVYGTGTIVKTYKKGEKIPLIATITASHLGYFQYSICPLTYDEELETEECFAQYPLNLTDGSDRFILNSHESKDYEMSAYLPENLTCEHCVLRWQYVTGNNWGICENGTDMLGCGPQEIFRTCSDIRITA